MYRQAREQIKLEVARAFFAALETKLATQQENLQAAKDAGLPGEVNERAARARATEAELRATAQEILSLGGEVPE